MDEWRGALFASPAMIARNKMEQNQVAKRGSVYHNVEILGAG